MWLHFFAFYVPLIKSVKIYERTSKLIRQACTLPWRKGDKSCQAARDNLVGFLRSSRDKTARACTLLPTEDNAFTLASYCEVAHLSASFLQSTAQFFFRRVFLSWANAPLACKWFYPRYYSYGKKRGNVLWVNALIIPRLLCLMKYFFIIHKCLGVGAAEKTQTDGFLGC